MGVKEEVGLKDVEEEIETEAEEVELSEEEGEGVEEEETEGEAEGVNEFVTLVLGVGLIAFDGVLLLEAVSLLLVDGVGLVELLAVVWLFDGELLGVGAGVGVGDIHGSTVHPWMLSEFRTIAPLFVSAFPSSVKF